LRSSREQYVSRTSVRHYVRALVCNNNYNVCKRNRSGAFARYDSLP
jgi:hypothetical protein